MFPSTNTVKGFLLFTDEDILLPVELWFWEAHRKQKGTDNKICNWEGKHLNKAPDNLNAPTAFSIVVMVSGFVLWLWLLKITVPYLLSLSGWSLFLFKFTAFKAYFFIHNLKIRLINWQHSILVAVSDCRFPHVHPWLALVVVKLLSVIIISLKNFRFSCK